MNADLSYFCLNIMNGGVLFSQILALSVDKSFKKYYTKVNKKQMQSNNILAQLQKNSCKSKFIHIHHETTEEQTHASVLT